MGFNCAKKITNLIGFYPLGKWLQILFLQFESHYNINGRNQSHRISVIRIIWTAFQASKAEFSLLFNIFVIKNVHRIRLQQFQLCF